MENSMVTQEFLSYLQFEKRFSEHTAKCYGADLAQFGDFLAGRSEGSEAEPYGSGFGGGGAAVATEAKAQIGQLLLSVDINSVRAYMSLLN